MTSEALAEIVVMTIKAALAPVREEVARLEGELHGIAREPLMTLEGLRQDVRALSDRVVQLEAQLAAQRDSVEP